MVSFSRYLEPLFPRGSASSHCHQQGARFQLLPSLPWTELDGCACAQGALERAREEHMATDTEFPGTHGQAWVGEQ